MPKADLTRFFPDGTRLLLNGGGRSFVEKLGEEATRKAIAAVLAGENVRSQTEFLTARRVAQVCGGIVRMFANAGAENVPMLSELAIKQIEAGGAPRELWPANWTLGLTGKSTQNVLRGDPKARRAYVSEFERAVADSGAKCRADLGDLTMTLGVIQPAGAAKSVELDWEGICRLTAAIGSATLTIRGSDKSSYGKLFEPLILGSVLTLLGFTRTRPRAGGAKSAEPVFWLSDSKSDLRECDAVAIPRLGKVAKFDIGFIGPGNSEISKDKLSRFARQHEHDDGTTASAKTFIVVDRLPETSKTLRAAQEIDAELIQMSMQYWPRTLAGALYRWAGHDHPLRTMTDTDSQAFIARGLAKIKPSEFLSDAPVEDEDE